MKRKNRKFSDQERLRADSRMLSKGVNTLYQGRVGLNPSERYGVSERQVTLKQHPKAVLKGKLTLAKRVAKETKNPIKIISTFIKAHVGGAYRNGSADKDAVKKPDTGEIRMTKRKGKYYKNKKQYRSILMHELFHSMHLANEYPGANAIGTYLDNHFNKQKTKMKPEEIVDNSIKLQSILELVKPWENTTEYDKVGGVYLEQAGNKLGDIAYAIEKQVGKDGAGLFFLRDILNGHNATFVISRISRGDLDKEINEWQKMNPRLLRLLKS